MRTVSRLHLEALAVAVLIFLRVAFAGQLTLTNHELLQVGLQPWLPALLGRVHYNSLVWVVSLLTAVVVWAAERIATNTTRDVDLVMLIWRGAAQPQITAVPSLALAKRNTAHCGGHCQNMFEFSFKFYVLVSYALGLVPAAACFE